MILETKIEEINKIIEEHGKWLLDTDKGQRADLGGASLIGANLKYANLRNASLIGADLRGASLRGADLRGADLTEADLRNASLIGANLRHADLRNADLRGANLRYVDLIDADLRGANLRDATLIDANLRGAKYGEEELLKLNTVLGLEWDILMFQDIVTVGCKKYSLEEWKNFSDIEIDAMDKKALSFYPVLMAILKHEYRNTKWSF